jgi:hypothetical protein
MAAAEAAEKIADLPASTNAWPTSAGSAAIALAIRSILDRGRTTEAADQPEPMTTASAKLFAELVCETFHQSRCWRAGRQRNQQR